MAEPVFPEDIERTISEVLLKETRGMYSAMSLVAYRFYAWTKPVTFNTVIVRPHKNWVERVNDWLLPNASLIRILVLDLPNIAEDELGNDHRARFSDHETTAIRRLLYAAGGHVKHFAVTWNIWAHLERECGAIPVKSLYLMWDRAMFVDRPNLSNLQHPLALKDLTVHAPRDLGLRSVSMFHQSIENYCPQTRHCPNLAYVTYAAYSAEVVNERGWGLKGSMFVRVGSRLLTAEEEDESIKEEKKNHPNFSTAYIGSVKELLEEWVAKVEGRPSILVHPAPREA